MSSLTTLARPYARAAFELARERDTLGDWSRALAAASVAASEPRMADWLASPDLDRAAASDLILEAAGRPEDGRFARFLGVLAENDRLALLPEVAALFEELRQEAENRLSVRVVSALPLSEDQSERLGAALARRYDREIELHNEVDRKVLGGAVIYAGDEVIDGSLRGRLNRLENSLT